MAPSAANKFPSISHPLSRLGSIEALSVSGRSRDGIESVDWSRKSPSPQALEKVRCQSVVGSIPSSRTESIVTSRCSTSMDGRRISTDEVMQVLEEKLRSGNFHSIRKLFRSNDPNGEGKISKEAFSRILWHICGYLSPRQISHVIRKLGLSKAPCIQFEDLISYFRRPISHGGAADPIAKSSNLMKPPNSAPERMIGETMHPGQTIRAYQNLTPESMAKSSWEALKARAASGNLDFHSLFPPMCFGDGAYVIPGQLRECLTKLDIPSSDDIVARIFRTLDNGSPFAMHTSRLFKHLGLNKDGKLIAPTSSGDTSRKETPQPQKISQKTELEQNLSQNQRPTTSFCDVAAETESPRPATSMSVVVRPKTSLDYSTKVFRGDIVDYVAKKLDEGQTHFIRALEAKDPNKKGLISKPDLREVFRILGIPVKATNLEHFLARNGLRRNDGVVSYKLLLRRLQTRSGRGLLNRVMRSQDHLFHDPVPPQTPSEGPGAALLETKLLDIFQKEFLALLVRFRTCDPSGTGLLTMDEFKSSLEDRFNVKIAEESWNSLIASKSLKIVKPPNMSSPSVDGYVAYNDFLAKFDVMLRPASVDAEDPWREEEADLSRLKEHKDRYLKSMDVDPATHMHRHEPRPLAQLEATLVDVLLYKFYNFKKEYDIIVREDDCRVDKEKFDYILFRCGFILTPSELSRLWLSMPITRPMESLSIPTILQQVIRLYYSSLQPGKFSKSSRDSTIVTCILEKIRTPIVSHWNLLKKKLRYLDPMGTSRIEKNEMLQILRGLRLNITDLELYYLVEMLESRISGKTNYFRLMEYYVKTSKQKQSTYNEADKPLLSADSNRGYKVYGGKQPMKQHDYRHPTPQKPAYICLRNAPATPPFKRINMQPGLTKPRRKRIEAAKVKENYSVLHPKFDYRGRYEALQRHPPSTQQSFQTEESYDSLVQKRIKPHIRARDFPFMGRALRREDKDERGRISVKAFQKILVDYGVSIHDPNEMYKLLSRYDKQMREEISYEKFMKALLQSGS